MNPNTTTYHGLKMEILAMVGLVGPYLETFAQFLSSPFGRELRTFVKPYLDGFDPTTTYY